MVGRPRENEVGRFKSKVKLPRDFLNKCHEWASAKDKDGYGLFQISQPRKTVKAHRFSYCLYNDLDIRTLGSDIIIRHTCDNPGCVNPFHLKAGSTQDNIDDKMQKGRFVVSKPNAKLSEKDIPYIRKRIQSGESHRKIALDYGVKRSTISQIACGNNWKNV